MKEQDKKQLKLEIAHIFASGANELRIFEMVESFIDKRQALSQSEWISVDDRLPDKGQLVLVYGLHRTEIYDYAQNKSIGKVEFKTIDYSSCIDTCYYEQYYSDITHWMPLPQPPQTK